ncbi:AcrR family transcriptional regulator [Hamadaea flava]|uniref:TetR/AcrR family transcriptional regulator n=1 Tax=Hamadaea flava TaxID=1742688 RepID=A0ABV8LI01_9ACTN|nr:TetR/AcrR family transcriptional regulator [Hamadaea flava]MCP2324368.1 AcrR family transcriptional regulator [Hamadaea flava]
MSELNLRARKQQRARDEIIEAAYALFAERGYPVVTVADIADRAEVGRTTFFRYFGDKQEVVFANEQDWLDDVTRRYRDASTGREPTLAQALVSLRDVAEAVSAAATKDPRRYRVREQLIADNPELTDRAARKRRRFAELLTEILREQGAEPSTATLAPQVALACFTAGHEIAGTDPRKLWPAVAAAFDALGIA